MESTSFIYDILPHILLPLAMVFSLSCPNFKGRGVIWSFTITCLAYLTYRSKWPTDSQFRYGMLTSWLWFVPTIEKLLFHIPEQEYWQLSRSNKAIVPPNGGKMKFLWAIALLINPRGIRWNYEIRGISQSGTIDRGAFLKKQTVHFAQSYIILEAALLNLSRWDLPSILDEPDFSTRLLIGLSSAVIIYSSWEMQWAFASLLGVGSYLSEPVV